MYPDVNFVIASDVLPNAMAFGAASPSAGPQFHSEVIPEGYIVLRHVAVLPFEASLEPKRLAAAFNKTSPVAIVRNDSAIAVGSTWLAAFDRLEVLESMAEAQINAIVAGIDPITVISGQDIDDIERVFFLQMNSSLFHTFQWGKEKQKTQHHIDLNLRAASSHAVKYFPMISMRSL